MTVRPTATTALIAVGLRPDLTAVLAQELDRGGTYDREDPVTYRQRLLRKPFTQQLGELRVEAFYLLGSHAGSNGGAGPQPPPPTLVRVGHADIEGEGLYSFEAGERHVPQPVWVEAVLLRAHPALRVMPPDEFGGGVPDLALGRVRVEVGNEEPTAWPQHPAHLRSGLLAFEPVPALGRAHHVVGPARQSCLLRPPHRVRDGDARLTIQAPGLFQHGLGHVDARDLAAARCESTRQRSGSRTKVEDQLVPPTDPKGRQPLEESIGEVGAVPPVLPRGLAEIHTHLPAQPTVTRVLAPARAAVAPPSRLQQPREVLGRVQGAAAGAVQDLLPAGGAGSDDHALLRPPHRRKQPPLPHLHRDLVVALLVAEESSHPATAGVNHLDVGARSQRERSLRRAGAH